MPILRIPAAATYYRTLHDELAQGRVRGRTVASWHEETRTLHDYPAERGLPALWQAEVLVSVVYAPVTRGMQGAWHTTVPPAETYVFDAASVAALESNEQEGEQPA